MEDSMMSKRNPRFVAVRWLACWCLLIPWNLAIAQMKESTAAPEGNGAGSTAVRPIAADELPERMQQTAAIVRAALADAKPLPGIQEIEKALPAFSKGTTALLAKTREVVRVQRSAAIIREMRTAWGLASDRLKGWQSLLKKRSAALQQDLTRLEQEAGALAAAKTTALDQKLPAELMAELDRQINSIRDAKESVVARRNTILKVQSVVAELGIETDKIDEELAGVESRERVRVLEFDAPPIWRPEGKSASHPQEVRARALDSQPVEEVLRLYLAEVLSVVVAQALAFAAILVMFLLLRERGARWRKDADPPVRSLGVVIGRPLSSALLVSLLAGSLWHAKAPEFLQNLGLLLLLIPLLRVISSLLPADVKPAIWLLAGIYAVGPVVRSLPAYATSTRVLILALTAAAAGGLLWLERRLRSKGAPGGWRSAALVSARTAIGLLAVAFAGEVFGATGLSRYLFSAVLLSAYSAVVLYGLYPAAQGCLNLVLRAREDEAPAAADERDGSLTRRMPAGLRWVMVTGFAVMCMKAFLVTDVVIRAVKGLVTYQVRIGAIEFTAGSVMVFAAVLATAALVSRVLRFILSSRLYRRIDLRQGAGAAISKLLHYAVLTAGFLLAMGAAGIDLNKLTLLAGGLSVGIGLGLQNITNNFVSGLILLFERPLHVGDKITVGPTSGEVTDIGIRASKIRTLDGADVVIPNGSLISAEFTNWTLSDDRRRGEITIGVAYGTDPERVVRILVETAKAQSEVLEDPAPAALFTGFGESSLDFVLQYWTVLGQYVEVRSQIMSALCDRLTREGIGIPFPQRDLNLRGIDPAIFGLLRSTPSERIEPAVRKPDSGSPTSGGS